MRGKGKGRVREEKRKQKETEHNMQQCEAGECFNICSSRRASSAGRGWLEKLCGRKKICLKDCAMYAVCRVLYAV